MSDAAGASSRDGQLSERHNRKFPVGQTGNLFCAAKSPEKGRKRSVSEKTYVGICIFPVAELLKSEINRIFVH